MDFFKIRCKYCGKIVNEMISTFDEYTICPHCHRELRKNKNILKDFVFSKPINCKNDKCYGCLKDESSCDGDENADIIICYLRSIERNHTRYIEDFNNIQKALDNLHVTLLILIVLLGVSRILDIYL